jgi:hypothetical protein
MGYWDIPDEEGGGIYIVYKENVTIKHPETSLDYAKSTILSTEYGANNVSFSGVFSVFDDFFPSSYTVDNGSATPKLRYKNYEDGPSVRHLKSSPWQAPNNLSHHLGRLATAMTNTIRSSVSKEMLQGEAYYMEKSVLVRWEWLTFPLLLLLLSLAFLVSTMIKTSKDAGSSMWKTSAMPTLIYSLPKETHRSLTPLSSLNSAHEISKKVRIRLLPNMGWRVSGQSQLPRTTVQVPREWI